MHDLDCETRDIALRSVSALYGVSQASIDSFLRRIDLDAYYETNEITQPGHETITLLLERQFGKIKHIPNRVHWFHLTRTTRSAMFTEGILPLDAALDQLWNLVFEVFQDTQHSQRLKVLRREGVPDFQYNLKAGKPFHGGPYAILVRDVAFQAERIGAHDYLLLPEILEDICNGYHKRFGEKIHDQLVHTLSPCIVKFWDPDFSAGHLESAIYYLYLSANGKVLGQYANTCFDGKGSGIPYDRIEKVEHLSGSPLQ